MKPFEMQLILIVLGINFFLALIFLVVNLVKLQFGKGIVLFLFFVFVPVIGITLFTLSGAYNKLLSKSRDKADQIDGSEISFSKTRHREYLNPNIEKAINQISVEEALLMSDKANRREVFIDLLKNDEHDDSMGIIRDAVENEDTEIAHFAAAFVTDAIVRYKTQEQELYKKCRKGDPEVLIEYAQYVIGMLKNDIFSKPERRVYIEHLEQVINTIIKKNIEDFPKEIIARMVELWQEFEETEAIERWIGIAFDYCMENLEVYKVCLKYYYANGKTEEFFALLALGRESDLELDSETLEWVRFYANA